MLGLQAEKTKKTLATVSFKFLIFCRDQVLPDPDDGLQEAVSRIHRQHEDRTPRGRAQGIICSHTITRITTNPQN